MRGCSLSAGPVGWAEALGAEHSGIRALLRRGPQCLPLGSCSSSPSGHPAECVEGRKGRPVSGGPCRRHGPQAVEPLQGLPCSWGDRNPVPASVISRGGGEEGAVKAPEAGRHVSELLRENRKSGSWEEVPSSSLGSWSWGATCCPSALRAGLEGSCQEAVPSATGRQSSPWWSRSGCGVGGQCSAAEVEGFRVSEHRAGVGVGSMHLRALWQAPRGRGSVGLTGVARFPGFRLSLVGLGLSPGYGAEGDRDMQKGVGLPQPSPHCPAGAFRRHVVTGEEVGIMQLPGQQVMVCQEVGTLGPGKPLKCTAVHSPQLAPEETGPLGARQMF